MHADHGRNPNSRVTLLYRFVTRTVDNDNRNYLVEPGTKERWMISLPSDSICILDPSLDMYYVASIH